MRDLTRHQDERGSLTEVLRADWPEFTQFGQAIVTVNLPGVIRGWHWHHRQTDTIIVIDGRAKVPLYDARPQSPTHGRLEEFLLGDSRLAAVVVPPGVYHGYVTVGQRPAIILNFPDRVYDPNAPDEERVAADDPQIGYAWDGSE